MTGPPGTGGTPPRPAGYVVPGVPDVAAGARNVVRARQVIVSGPAGTVTGVFVYATGAVPGAGTGPVVAITNQSKDPFGNSVNPGDSVAGASMIVLGTAGSYAQTVVSAGLAELLLGTGDVAESAGGQLQTAIVGAGGTRQLQTFVSSPTPQLGNPAIVVMQSDSIDGTIKSNIQLQCVNRTNFGLSGNAWWADGTQQLNLPVSGGPFIFGESFHTISNAAGFTGTMRVKKLPWNGVWLDVNVTLTGSTGGTFNFGSLPDATYYPTSLRAFPLSYTGVPSALAGATRVIVPTSGAVQIVTGSFTAGGSVMSGDVMYPTN